MNSNHDERILSHTEESEPGFVQQISEGDIDRILLKGDISCNI
jgi:hypothetical protein